MAGTVRAREGLVALGLVVGIGFAVALLLQVAAFEFKQPQQWTWGVIDASYHAVGLLVACAIIGLID